MSNSIYKRFESVFIKDTSKLTRLLSVVDERFKEMAENSETLFEIETKKGKSFKTTNIDEILKHDNSVKNPILGLSILFRGKDETLVNECNIFYSRETSIIDIHIQAEDSRKANDLFAEIEEQIERSLSINWVYKLKQFSLIDFLPILMVIILIPSTALVFYATDSQKKIKNSDHLSSEDIEYLSNLFPSSESEEGKINYIYEYHSRKLKNIQAEENQESNLFSKGKLLNIKVLLSVLPFIIVLGGTYYTIWRTYIGSVFLWGDFEEYYNTLLERRKFLWGTVVVALVIGVIGNLFVFGFSQYL
jgi:hypothetical protein